MNWQDRMTNKLFFIYLCVPLITMLIIFYSGINFEGSALWNAVMTIFLVCMLAGNMLFFYIFQKYTENLNETYQQKAEINEEFLETLHNITHYMKIIEALAYENKNDEIREVVETLNGKLNRQNNYEYSHHKRLNTILSEYQDKALKAEIDFDAYVEPGCVLEHIPNLDLITMLGNILDNAILAASEKAGAVSVIVRIFMQKNGKLCIIKVANDFTGNLKEDNGKLLSTKKEEGMHGIGMTSVSRIAGKCGGYLEHYVEDSKFNTILVLQVPASNE